MQLSVNNSHLLPGIKKRLFVATLLGWLIISISATLFDAFFCVLLDAVNLNRLVFFWLFVSFAMGYFVFFIRNIFIPLAIYLSCIFYREQFALIVLPLLDQYLLQFCIANVIIIVIYFFQVTHPSLAQANFYQNKFTNQFRLARGETILYKSAILLYLKKINQSLYLFCIQQKIKTKKSILYFGFSGNAHWSKNLLFTLITFIVFIAIKLLELIGIITAETIQEIANVAIFSLVWGIPLSIIASTMIAIELTKKEQRLLYLLPNTNQSVAINQTFFRYLAKNNAISMLIFIGLIVMAKFFLYLAFADWMILILCCSLPLFSLILRDYRHTTFSNSTLLYLFMIYISMTIISGSSIFYWNLSVWSWNCGLILASIALFAYRWQKMMRSPPAFPADCA
jgi:hypothetical protein